jgi:hypothetical protein
MYLLDDVVSGKVKIKGVPKARKNRRNGNGRNGNNGNGNGNGSGHGSAAAVMMDAKRVNIYLNSETLDDIEMYTIREHFAHYRGACSVYLYLHKNKKMERVLALGDEYRVMPDTGFFEGLKSINSAWKVDVV